jgi:membrane peptidoglycan carboxypeptidase
MAKAEPIRSPVRASRGRRAGPIESEAGGVAPMIGHHVQNRPRGRWRRAQALGLRVLLGLAGVLVVVFAAGAVYLVTLRGVGDAETRVQRILALHHASSDGLPAPPRLVAAVVSVEDEHFYDNVVVNVLTGAGRAAVATLQASPDPGGSTIDQQLAKLLYGRGSGLTATLGEIGLGVKLALSYSKQQILAMYLNAAYYGHGFWGVAAASRGYFGVEPVRLTWPEASMLGGLLQAPSAYDPLLHLSLGRRRQRHVLDQLVVNHYLTRSQANAAFATALPLTR